MTDINYLNINTANGNRIVNRKNKTVRNTASYRADHVVIPKKEEFVYNDKKKNKTKIIAYTIGSIITAAIIFLGAACWYKGRGADNTEKKFFEYIKDGWKELRKKSDKPKENIINRSAHPNEPNQLKSSKNEIQSKNANKIDTDDSYELNFSAPIDKKKENVSAIESKELNTETLKLESKTITEQKSLPPVRALRTIEPEISVLKLNVAEKRAISPEPLATEKIPAKIKADPLTVAPKTDSIDKETIAEKSKLSEIAEELNTQEKNKTKQSFVSRLFSKPKLLKVDKAEYPKAKTDIFGITRTEKIVTNANGDEYILKENYKDGVIINSWYSKCGEPNSPHCYIEFRNGKMISLTKYKKRGKGIDFIEEFDSQENLIKTTLFNKWGSYSKEVKFYDIDTCRIKRKEYYNKSNDRVIKEMSLNETTNTIKETFFCKDGYNVAFENILTPEGKFISQNNYTHSTKGWFVKILRQLNT